MMRARFLLLATLTVSCSQAVRDRPPGPSGPAKGDPVEVAVPGPAIVADPAPRSLADRDAAVDDALLLDPSRTLGPAPAEFRVRFETTRGPFDVRCMRAWAPNGVDRFHHLVRIGFFRDIAVFRMVAGFVAQFGIHGDPRVSAAWKDAEIPVDTVERSNTAGTISFAMAARPTSRTTQVFVNLTDNARLDDMGFAPVCEVVAPGLDTVASLFSGYAETASREQGRIQREGNAFLRKEFPDLDYIVSARLLDDPR